MIARKSRKTKSTDASASRYDVIVQLSSDLDNLGDLVGVCWKGYDCWLIIVSEIVCRNFGALKKVVSPRLRDQNPHGAVTFAYVSLLDVANAIPFFESESGSSPSPKAWACQTPRRLVFNITAKLATAVMRTNIVREG